VASRPARATSKTLAGKAFVNLVGDSLRDVLDPKLRRALRKETITAHDGLRVVAAQGNSVAARAK